MKRWVFTSRIEPANLAGVVSGRFGSNVLFVSYSRLLRQWYWVYPGTAEKIAEPQMLFLDDLWAREHPREKSVVRREKPLAIRQQRAEQLMLL